MGRFITPDPYQASGGPSDPESWNRYAYTRGDPVNRSDISGLADSNCPTFGICVGKYPRDSDLFPNFGASPSIGKGSDVVIKPAYDPDIPDQNLSNDCINAISATGVSRAGVGRALKAASNLQAAAESQSVDWRMIAAIGVYETNFLNRNENDGTGVGVGIFQFTNGGAEARNLTTASDKAAAFLADNLRQILSVFPNLSGNALAQALADSWNAGAGGVILNIQAGRSPDYHTSPIRQNGVVVGYRGGGDGQYGSDILSLMGCFN